MVERAQNKDFVEGSLLLLRRQGGEVHFLEDQEAASLAVEHFGDFAVGPLADEFESLVFAEQFHAMRNLG